MGVGTQDGTQTSTEVVGHYTAPEQLPIETAETRVSFTHATTTTLHTCRCTTRGNQERADVPVRAFQATNRGKISGVGEQIR